MRVPAELLIQIIEEAALPANSLSYSRDTSTLYSLCLVSHVVRSIAFPLLYGAIHIRDATRLNLLLRTLKSATTPYPITSVALCNQDVSPRGSREAVSLFSYTPNLRRLLTSQDLPLYNVMRPIIHRLGDYSGLEEVVLHRTRRSFRWEATSTPINTIRRVAIFAPFAVDRDIWEVPGDLWEVPKLEVVVFGPVCRLSKWQCERVFPAMLRRRMHVKRIVLLNPPRENYADGRIRFPFEKEPLREGLRMSLGSEKWEGAEVVVVENRPEAGNDTETWRQWMTSQLLQGTLWNPKDGERVFP